MRLRRLERGGGSGSPGTPAETRVETAASQAPGKCPPLCLQSSSHVPLRLGRLAGLAYGSWVPADRATPDTWRRLGRGCSGDPGRSASPFRVSFQRCTWALPLVLSLHPRPCRKSPGPGAALGGALAPTQGLASAAAPAEVTRGIPLGYRHSPGGGIPLTGTEGALLFGPHATGRALRFPACSCALIQLISSRAPPPPPPCDLVLGFRDLSRVSLEVSSAGGIKLFPI